MLILQLKLQSLQLIVHLAELMLLHFVQLKLLAVLSKLRFVQYLLLAEKLSQILQKIVQMN